MGGVYFRIKQKQKKKRTVKFVQIHWIQTEKRERGSMLRLQKRKQKYREKIGGS